MRLVSVWIESFKNLQNLYVRFDEASPYTVLVGENGAGKSNLIEAVTYIFRNLDLEFPAPFTYKLIYQCGDNDVQVEADAERYPQFWVRRTSTTEEFKSIPRIRYMAEDASGRPLYRPAFVFGYYSGPSNRLAELYEYHTKRFYGRLIRPEYERDNADDALSSAPGIKSANASRRLFYAQTLHGQFALLAFFMDADSSSSSDRAFLREYLQIEGLDSVLFCLRQPPWPPRPGGDARFWGAVGEVSEFLDRLYEAALAPTRMRRRIELDLQKNPSIENLYLFLPGQRALDAVYRNYADQYSFFTALESTHLSKLLGEVRARVRLTPSAGGGALTFRDLSEGEQQLLLVLGLLKFTARDEALFLLDEPDTHLNPAWSTQYLEFLGRFIDTRTKGNSCHIVMTTHDPLVFAGLTRSEVQILRTDKQGRVHADIPSEDPAGMGVAAILTSDLFRLRSTLDRPTQDKLDRQRLLIAKSDRSEQEEAELQRLNNDLDGRGFSRTMRDPLYELFVKAWVARQDPDWRRAAQLTPEQMEARTRLADEIVRELLAEQEAEEDALH